MTQCSLRITRRRLWVQVSRTRLTLKMSCWWQRHHLNHSMCRCHPVILPWSCHLIRPCPHSRTRSDTRMRRQSPSITCRLMSQCRITTDIIESISRRHRRTGLLMGCLQVNSRHSRSHLLTLLLHRSRHSRSPQLTLLMSKFHLSRSPQSRAHTCHQHLRFLRSSTTTALRSYHENPSKLHHKSQ